MALGQTFLMRQTDLLEATLKADISKLIIACIINLLAVSTVFMTQPIFLELSESFKTDMTQARLSFSTASASLSYAAAFLFLGPAADKFDLPKIAFTGLLLLAIAVLFASYVANFGFFIVAMSLVGMCAAFIWDRLLPQVLWVSFSGESQWAFSHPLLGGSPHLELSPFFFSFYRSSPSFLWLKDKTRNRKRAKNWCSCTQIR